MKEWRPDLQLLDLWNGMGPVWALLAVAIMVYVAFAGITRAAMATMLLLVCTQVWFGPLYAIARVFRWYVLLILLVRGVLFLVRAVRPPDEPQGSRRVVAALGALALASVLWSEHMWFSFEYAASFCIGLAVTFGLFWRLVDLPDAVPTFLRGTFLLALAVFPTGFLIVALSEWTESWAVLDATHFGGRYSGVFINPNAAGLLGAVLLPIVIAAPRMYVGRLALLRLPLCACIAATIFLSGSRSALIGSTMALVLLALYRYGSGAVVMISLAGVATAFLAVYAPIEDIDDSAFGNIARTKHLGTLSGRMEMWEKGWDDAQENLVFGQGWGKSRVLDESVDVEHAMIVGAVVGATNLHNAHLQLLIDLGFVGVSLFWLFCLLVVRAGLRVVTAPKSPRNAIALIVFSSTLVMLADTWVHGSIWSMGSPTTIVFWGMCAVSVKEGYRARREAVAASYAPSPARASESPLVPAPAA